MNGKRVINPISPTSPGYLLIIYFFTSFRDFAHHDYYYNISLRSHISMEPGTGGQNFLASGLYIDQFFHENNLARDFLNKIFEILIHDSYGVASKERRTCKY